MSNIHTYNKFSNIYDFCLIVESDGKWIGDKVYEWDFSMKGGKKSLRDILSNMDKDSIKEYLNNILKYLRNKVGKKFLLKLAGVFLFFLSIHDVGRVYDDNNIEFDLNKMQKLNKIVELSFKKRNIVKKSSFEKAQEKLKKVEGGYTQHPNDKGNWVDGKLIGTNYGISAPTLKEYLGRVPTKKEMENLTYEKAEKIYKERFWDKFNLENIEDQNIANIIYDAVVNHGPYGTKKIIQRVLSKYDEEVNLADIYKEKGMKAINSVDPKKFFKDFKSERKIDYISYEDYETFGKGWDKRLDEFEYEEI